MTQTPVPAFGGCLWPVDPACETEEWLALPEDVRLRALALASATLSRLTGRRVTACPITVRPGPLSAAGCFPDRLTFDTTVLGHWASLGIPTVGFPDSRRVPLPAPVSRIDEVRVGDVVIDASLYRVEGRDLVWLGADAPPWPLIPDLYSPLGSPDTWSVTYLNGYPVDSLGAYAVGVLAMEYAKACTGKKCRLPSGAVTIARGGTTVEVPNGAFPDGFTGIREVDAFIALWNPRAKVSATTVWSPNMRRNTAVKVATVPGDGGTPGGVEDGGGPGIPGDIDDGGNP